MILCGFHSVCAQRRGNAQQKPRNYQPIKTESLWQQ
nr:MAG TPA: hypothetical protein [Caudoviricetes sp.]